MRLGPWIEGTRAPDGTLEIVDALGARTHVIVAIDAVPAPAQRQ